VSGLVVRLIAFALLGVAAFPPLPTGPLIFIALVPLIDAVRLAEAASADDRRQGRRAALLIGLGGALFFFLLLHWLLFVPPEEVTVPGLMVPATLAAALYLGLYVWLAQAAARRLVRLGLPLWLGLPVVWVGTEYLRTQTELGCPWGLLGYALTGTPVLMQGAAWFGVFGVSLVVALVNGLVYAAWRVPGHRRRFAFLAAGVVAAMWVQGTVAIGRLPVPRTLEVAIVQGDIGRKIKFKRGMRRANVERMVELTRMAIGELPAPDSLVVGAPHARPDLVLWPETAAPCYFRLEPYCRVLIEELVDRTGVPVATGFPDLVLEEGEVKSKWNAATVFLPGRGMVGQYNKVKLVPFGEAIPYQDRWTALRAIDFGEADFERGRGFVPLAFPAGDFGVMICFESIFPAAGREAARRGATFFVNITNDEWFGRSAGPYQHAAMATVRAIECRRGLARAANTGVSFVVDRAGRHGPTTPLFEPRLLHGTVELGDGTTPYMRIGDLVPRACLLVTLVGALIGWRRRPRATGDITGSVA
jgi:apolipoprotein N-acyltransferase